ncbi:hypothetical protein [Bacteroides sp. 224]|uniref:hypothetical protein n=1 Tax=Bacteroides sp. 224 TaxID=2302936 RepID=UPI0013CFA458|nr:hypothetical protein [Bacteroides sp. 224]NDV65145.1 hypothetical protein [Bacteroides sp. 224]
MILEEEYYFKAADFGSNGYYKTTDKLFSDFVCECEKMFHKKHEPYYANCFCANSKTFLLMGRCFIGGNFDIWGMETFDGGTNLRMNIKITSEIGRYSRFRTIYAISQYDNLYKSLWLFIDNNLSDNIFLLKYNSDNDDDKPVIRATSLIEPELKKSVEVCVDQLSNII